MIKNYYKILEIEENFTEDLLKKKYRELSKKYHPDINQDGGDKFKEINEAYETLSDPNKRKQYDFERNGGGGDGIFEHFFGKNNRRAAPLDKMLKLVVTPIEIYLGSSRDIHYDRDILCNSCDGNGGKKKSCNDCNGKGVTFQRFGSGFFMQQIAITCQSCGGSGEVIEVACNNCGGKGSKSTKNTISIQIPKNADNGQYLKIDSHGDYNNGGWGDLILQVNVIESDGFMKVNNDLVYKHFLGVDDLKLTKYKIPHPDGELIVTAPNVFDTTIPLKVSKKGYNGGDFFIKVEVKFERNQSDI